MSAELSEFVTKGMARNRALLLRALDTVTAQAVCAMVNLGTSRLSRLRNDQDEEHRTTLDIFCAILAACSLKLVPSNHVMVDPEELAAYRRLAAIKCREETADSQFGALQ